MNTCKTCVHWTKPAEGEHPRVLDLCNASDPDTGNPMDRGFEVRRCALPTQTFCEAPVERDGFGLTDGSEYMATLVTAEDFGCLRHEPAEDSFLSEDEAADAISSVKQGAYAAVHSRDGRPVVTLDGELDADALEAIAAVLRRTRPE